MTVTIMQLLKRKHFLSSFSLCSSQILCQTQTITTATTSIVHEFPGHIHGHLKRRKNKVLAALGAHFISVRNNKHSTQSQSYDEGSGNKKKRKEHYNIVTQLSKEIDLDAIKREKLKEFREKGIPFDISVIAKEILAEKCAEKISNLSAEEQKKLKVIQLEHDFLYSEGYAMPSAEEMTDEDWLEAMALPSMKKRQKYYSFCYKRAYLKAKRKEKSAVTPSPAPQESSGKAELRQWDDNKILLRLYDSTMKRWWNNRLASSMRFGIPLVLDMDYADLMEKRMVKNTATQLLDVYSSNRADPQMPFHLHLTGCPPDNDTYRMLQLQLQNDPHFMVSESPDSYLDLFDRERLVYLSPHSKQVMTHFDPNAVYIIGAFNDKTVQKPISYSRAKEQGIACQRLPLDQYLSWGVGSKSLTLGQVLRILQSVKNQETWPQAFKVIPSRKLSKQ